MTINTSEPESHTPTVGEPTSTDNPPSSGEIAWKPQRSNQTCYRPRGAAHRVCIIIVPDDAEDLEEEPGDGGAGA